MKVGVLNVEKSLSPLHLQKSERFLLENLASAKPAAQAIAIVALMRWPWMARRDLQKVCNEVILSV